MKCSRTACDNDLADEAEVFRIWNDASTDSPRCYCQTCGKTIIYWNRRDHGGTALELKFEVAPKGTYHYCVAGAGYILYQGRQAIWETDSMVKMVIYMRERGIVAEYRPTRIVRVG